MTDTQMLAMVAPITSLVIVVAGYIVQGASLNQRIGEVNACISELRTDFNTRMAEQNATLNARINDLRTDFKDVLRAELAAVRAEMAKNHSELLTALASHEHRITKP